MILGRGALFGAAGPAFPIGSWDLDNAKLPHVQQIVTLNGTHAIKWNKAQTKFYVAGWTSNVITQYDVGTPGDINTITNSGKSLTISSQEINPGEILFSDDELTVFIVGFDTGSIHSYSLLSPGEMLGGTFAASVSLLGSITTLTGAGFSFDGVRLYALDWSADIIYQYTLGTGFDITTINLTPTFSGNIGAISGTNQPHGLFVHPEETRCYVVDKNNNTTYQYDFDAKDISTISYSNIDFLDLSFVTSIDWNPTGDFVYICDETGLVRQYTVSL